MKRIFISLAFLLSAFAALQAQTFVVVGTGTTSNTSSSYPAPFGNYYWGARHQFFVTAAQLSAAGLPAGVLVQSMGFNVTALNSLQPHSNFQIRVFTTTIANPIAISWFTGTPAASTTPATYTILPGWNMFTFSSPFTWNGTDHLVIETCFNNTGSTNNLSTEWTTTGLGSGTWSRWYRANAYGVCTSILTTSTSTTTRPNIRIGYTMATPCTGTPSPGSTTTSHTSACPSTSITLGLSTLPDGTGLTFQWQRSTDGGVTWTNFGTSSATQTTTLSPFVTTQFRCIVTCTNSGLSGSSTPVTVNTNSNCQCAAYCSPVTNCASNDYIQNVTLLDGSSTLINNSTGCGGVNGFNLFTSPNPTLMQGQNYSLSVTTSSSNAQGLRVWFDWNGDGDYVEAGEEITLSPSNYIGTAPATYTATVTVPVSSALGSTRLRAKCNFFSAPPTDPCANTSWGETEDYCITIATPPPCSGTPSPGNTTASVTTACNGQSITLNYTGTVTGSGLNFNWEFSIDGGSTWTNFSSSAPPVTYTFGTSTTQFRCTVTCTNSGQSGTSTPVTVTTACNCQCLAYGASSATSTSDGEITNVTIGTVSNSSNCTTPAPGPGSLLNRYSNFTTSVAAHAADQGASVSFSVTVNTCGGTYSHHMKIYVDWNQDGDFVDTGEQVYVTSAPVSPVNTVSGSFTVPMTATPGTTRLRVVLMETTDATFVLPTGTYSFGETEDYCFTVNPFFTLTSAPGTDNQTLCYGYTGITPITYNAAGITSVSVSGLPPGISYAYSGDTVTISGTPTVYSGAYLYTVTGTGPCGTATATATGSITISGLCPSSLISPHCGIGLGAMSQVLVIDSMPAVQYEVRIQDGVTTHTLFRPNTGFYFSMLPSMPYAVTCVVDVRWTPDGSTWSGWGPACNVFTPPAQPLLRPDAPTCGLVMSSYPHLIKSETYPINYYWLPGPGGTAYEIYGATQYEFDFASTSPYHQVSRFTSGSSGRNLFLNLGAGLRWAYSYRLRIRSFVPGLGWSGWGDSCNITTPPIPLTQLQAGHCGATITSTAQVFQAVAMHGAIQYEFRITDGVNTWTVLRPNRGCYLLLFGAPSWAAGTYTVDVRWRTSYDVWSPWGPPCDLYLPAPLNMEAGGVTEEWFDVQAFPVPFGDVVNLTVETTQSAPVRVTVMDVNGRVVEDRQAQMEHNGLMTLGESWANGVYMLRVQQGAEVRTLRVVKAQQ